MTEKNTAAFTEQEKAKIRSSVAFTLSNEFETDSNLMTMNKLNMSARDKVLLEHANFCADALELILNELVDFTRDDVEELLKEVRKETQWKK